MECDLNNTSTFKGYSNIYIQHVSKSAASTELTGQIKGVGEIPIPLLHSISVSFEIYGYPTISPNGRTKMKIISFCQNGQKPISVQSEKPKPPASVLNPTPIKG